VVCMDLAATYRALVRKHFPNAATSIITGSGLRYCVFKIQRGFGDAAIFGVEPRCVGS